MSISGLFISFLYLMLQIAVIVFIAYCFVWIIRWMGWGIDGNVYKWGQIIVGLLVIIAIAMWLIGALGGSAPMPLVKSWRW